MAEGQAKAGHDIMGLRTWYVSSQAERFVPVDDIVNPLLQKYGKVAMAAEYCAKIDGQWLAVPTCYGSSSLPPCARIDYLKEYCRARRAEDVPGARRPARQGAGRQLDLGNLRERRRGNAPRAGIRSASGSAPAPTRSTSRARCSLPMARR